MKETAKLKNAVLRIWYQKEGKAYPYNQGKILQNGGKWIYLADMSDRTLWKKFNGYSIAEQILEAFSKAKIKVKIIYRRKDLGTLYVTTPSKFKKSGIPVKFGGHTQYILCLPYWEVMTSPKGFEEPFDLPVMDIDNWLKGEQRFEVYENGRWVAL